MTTLRLLALQLFLLASVAFPAAAATAPEETTPWLPIILLVLVLALAATLRLLAKKSHQIIGLQQLNIDLIDRIPHMFLRLDSQLNIVEANQPAALFFAQTRQNLVGSSLEPLAKTLPFSADMIRQVMQDKKDLQLDKLFDTLHDRIWSVRISPWHDERQPGAVIQLEDVTDQIQMESLIIQKDKLATLSRVTTSMIHEITNPLASILQNMQLMHNRLSPQLQKNRLAADACGISMEKMEEYLRHRDVDKAIEAVRESARRAARVIENLIHFSSQENEKEALHSISTLLERAIELAAGDFDLKQQYDFRQINLVRKFDPALPVLRCRALKLQQAFFALLRFRAEQTLSSNPPESAKMTLNLATHNNHVRLQIDDNGPQISQADLEEHFRPGLRKANEGLGLCASFFIINKVHGGSIDCETNPDGGNSLVIELPFERPANG